MERIPPHNLEAEKSVIGAAMLDKEVVFDVLEVVRAEDFYSKANREIFTVITDLQRSSTPVDVLTVTDELKKRKMLEAVGGRVYVAQLSADVPSVSNAVEYAKIVAEKAVLRRLIGTADEIAKKGYEESENTLDILEYAEKGIFEIAKSKQHSEMAKISEIILTNFEEISVRSQSQGGITGVPSGLIDLDRKLSGFQKSDMVVLAARPSMGKTAFALNVALNAALKADAKVLIFSLEMAKEQLSQRLLSMEARVESQKMSTGDVDMSDWDKMSAALDSFNKMSIYIDDTPGIKLMEIKNKCRRMKAETGLDMIILDYLQLMEGEKRSDNRQQEITSLSRGMKLLAREMECPVIVLSQLSRAPDQRENHRPVLSDLRESGAIEQDADVVLFLYRDEVYNEETEKPGICEVIVAKHRNGPIGTVEVGWQGKYTRFVNLQR
ncbi:MAG TPA: replicative DNA helicase [Candidatus Eubacterium pullicola]|uniref:Replicative DNA helicase n=1 Tax=Gallibacter intestinalis TaxID=2779356 RepID=A0ABR9QXH1_9FIRM|nr:replicative DNA helicase [Gallibacter intestinalis]MBE5035571.1 replicative DNA helicase [Gallibacter intestinalis]HIW40161.1 replicative DNA helicase [Candidatus Eubacterium pullicola]